MSGFDLAKYLKSKMSPQAPQPNRPRSNAVGAQPAPLTKAQKDAVDKLASRMDFATRELLIVERVLKCAIDKLNSQRGVKKDVRKLQLVQGAFFRCEYLRGKILHELNSTRLVDVTEVKMKDRDAMLQNVVREMFGMANAVVTAAEQIEMFDRRHNTKLLEDLQGLGCFDPKLRHALGLVQPHGIPMRGASIPVFGSPGFGGAYGL